MINVWDYKNCDIIEIIDIDGEVFRGKIIDITDAGEKSDLEMNEDSITINYNQRCIEFSQSEIAYIKPITYLKIV